MTSVYVVDDSELLLERVIALISDNPKLSYKGQSNRYDGTAQKILVLKPDVVILDIRLGDGSGIDLLKELKKSPDCPKIIMFTNYAIPQYKERCLEFGADYFLDKGTGSKVLARTLQNIAEQAEAGIPQQQETHD
ncbi:MAG: response regulator transcription factor [Candidatus Marinimicrobia bacterium]|nr:response regulator transcription factor [FCB group bacterium]MBL7024883.1 response regulator transcription factor [Candidatus Neomarinimicrobiota bacterium]